MSQSFAACAAIAAVLAVLCGPGTAASSTGGGSGLVAYVAGSATTSVWVAALDGRDQRRLGPGSDPIVAPNGQWVAAAREASSGAALVLYGTAHPSSRSFFDVQRVTADPLAWSSDSRYLAVSLLGTSVNQATGADLAVIDASTGSYTIVAHGVIQGASFEPGHDQLAYASMPSLELATPVDVHTIGPTGAGGRQVTHGGDNLNPVWGPGGIAYDHETPRGKDAAPEYQISMVGPTGAGVHQITHLAVPSLVDGLEPLEFSASGNRMLAEYVGEDTSYAWTVTISSRSAQELEVDGKLVQGAAISPDGSTLLVSAGAFMSPASHGVVETVGYGGGTPKVIVKGAAEPSWAPGA